MSSISAGTTLNTGLVYTSDSTGTLQLKTGASAVTAVNIDASQNVGVNTTPVEKITVLGRVQIQQDAMFLLERFTVAQLKWRADIFGFL